jgi:outer membrane protein OmpA-like peptidoglycan-associated protein
MRKIIMGSLIAMTTGCMTYDPYTDDKKVSDSTTGAILGAGLGAIAGNQVKGDRRTRDKAMAAGVLLGAGIGGAVGNQMDKQAAALRAKLRGSGVSVTKQGNTIVLNMPGAITFATGQATINSGFYDVLDSVASVISEYKKTNVEIGGHTDNKGSIESNNALSQQRANAVAAYFRSKGVAPSRITAVGYGKSNPIADNSSEGGRSQNRRVEVILTPAG